MYRIQKRGLSREMVKHTGEKRTKTSSDRFASEGDRGLDRSLLDAQQQRAMRVHEFLLLSPDIILCSDPLFLPATPRHNARRTAQWRSKIWSRVEKKKAVFRD